MNQCLDDNSTLNFWMVLKIAVSKQEKGQVETQVNSSLGHVNVTLVK